MVMKSLQKRQIRETDLYPPLHDYLDSLGYSIRSEVKDCDIVATLGEQLVIVEMKSSFNATLLIQAVKRQKMTDSVYIAIPDPKRGKLSRKWNDLCYLVRRLELGMLLVNFSTTPARVIPFIHPSPFDLEKSRRQGKRKAARLVLEARERHGDYNTGGSCGKKIMTVYKEHSLEIACFLERSGELSLRRIKALGACAGEKTGSILQKNFYGWFERVEKGVYRLTDTGRDFMSQYPELVAFYRSKMDQAQNK